LGYEAEVRGLPPVPLGVVYYKYVVSDPPGATQRVVVSGFDSHTLPPDAWAVTANHCRGSPDADNYTEEIVCAALLRAAAER
jgi:hypothetical protein